MTRIYRIIWLGSVSFIWIRVALPIIGSIIFWKNAQITPDCIPEEAIPALFWFMLFLSWIAAFVAILLILNIHYILQEFGLTEEICEDCEDGKSELAKSFEKVRKSRIGSRIGSFIEEETELLKSIANSFMTYTDEEVIDDKNKN